MPSIRVDAFRTVPIPISVVRQCLTDFVEGQPRLLPSVVRDYAVLQGGIGEGTVATCIIPIRNRDRHFSFRISEPITYKTITAYDHDSHLTMSWYLRTEGNGTEVQIEAFWLLDDSPWDLFVHIWAQIIVRRYLNHILGRLPAVIEENGYAVLPL
jgi:hypothetical protein